MKAKVCFSLASLKFRQRRQHMSPTTLTLARSIFDSESLFRKIMDNHTEDADEDEFLITLEILGGESIGETYSLIVSIFPSIDLFLN